MSIKKPSTFPLRTNLDGSEEIYTQTNGVSEKFTLGTLASYITSNADEWLYKEVLVTPFEMYGNVAPITLLDEADLGLNEYFEINRIIIESDFNTIPMTSNGNVYLIYKPNAAASLFVSEAFHEIPQSFLETTADSVLCFYAPHTANVFRRNNGFFLQSFPSAPGEGDTDFLFKIYYKIVS